MGRGQGDPSCCSAVSFPVSVSEVNWCPPGSARAFLTAFYRLGAFFDNRKSDRNVKQLSSPGGGPLGTQLLLQQSGQVDHIVWSTCVGRVAWFLPSSCSRSLTMRRTGTAPRWEHLTKPQRKQEVPGRFHLTFSGR